MHDRKLAILTVVKVLFFLVLSWCALTSYTHVKKMAIDQRSTLSVLSKSSGSQSEFRVQHTAEGCVYTPRDIPVCVADNVCVGKGLVTFYVAPFDKTQWPWGSESNVSVSDDASLRLAWDYFDKVCCRFRKDVGRCMGAERLGFSCCRQSWMSKHEPRLINNGSTPFLAKSALLLDTAVDFFQFGHSLSKIFQLASFSFWADSLAPSHTICRRPTLALGIFSRISGVEVPVTIQEWLGIVAKLPSVQKLYAQSVRFVNLNGIALYGAQLRDLPSRSSAQCVRHAYFIQEYEQFFFRHTDAEQLNWQVASLLDLPKCPSNTAKHKGMMLMRKEGRRRRFTNSLEVEKLIKEMLNLDLETVIIDSSMSARQQISQFRKYGFVVSPHSSQLKNLAMACPCTIVIEINATNGLRDPFGIGLHHGNIIYTQSSHHVPITHGERMNTSDPYEMRIWDVSVNITRLREDIAGAIKVHRDKGCNVF